MLWQVPWLIPAATATSCTVWERLVSTNVATSWILSSVLAVLTDRYALHLPNCLSPVQNDCATETALRPKASAPYAPLIVWNFSLADMPNIWQNLTFSRCSNCDILDFLRSQTTALHNSDFLSEYNARNLFLLGRENNGHGTISWLHVSGVVHNSATMRPIHDYKLYYVHAVFQGRKRIMDVNN
jgi:hypothetical protein